MAELTALTPESLRALVMEERSDVFDIASRVLAAMSPEPGVAQARKVEKRLQQLSPETRACVSWPWVQMPVKYVKEG